MAREDSPTPSNLKLIDDSCFPIVRYRVPENPDMFDHGEDYLLQDLDSLLARDLPFVMITSGKHDQEADEIRKGRAIWFKANQKRFATLCRALIHLEPDRSEKQRMTADTQNLTAALGIPFTVVSSEAEAEQRAGEAML